ncbi:hypothetical protein SVAN01_01220 [Stagonosporopsis vannaccii]|nr:hypothetical protein SVAN01_01220 [Stagonosporopsis vannaccii]
MPRIWAITSSNRLCHDCECDRGSSAYSRLKSDFAQFIHRPHLRPFLANCTPTSARDELRIDQLRVLPEFQHWNDPVFGKENIDYDLWLISTGRTTLDGLFRRGAVGTPLAQLTGTTKEPFLTCTATRCINRLFKGLGNQLDWTDDESEDSESNNKRAREAQIALPLAHMPRCNSAMHHFSYDFDTDYPKAKKRNYGFRSTWNDVLRAASIYHVLLGTRGNIPVTCPPPRGFPNLCDFTAPLDLDMSFVRTLPEFRHWKDDISGSDAERRDVDLLNTGKISLVYLFLRGTVYTKWYRVIEGITGSENRHAYKRLEKLAGQRYEEYDAEVYQVDDDFAEVARVHRWDQLRMRRRIAAQKSAPRALSPRRPMSPAVLNDRPRDCYTPGYTPTFNSGRSSASDTHFGPARHPLREHSPPVSPRNKPMRGTIRASSGPSKPAELEFGDMPAIQVCRQAVTEAGPSTQPQPARAAEPSLSEEDVCQLAEKMFEEHLVRCKEETCEPGRMHTEAASSTRPISDPIFEVKTSDVVSFSSTGNDATQDPRSEPGLDTQRRLAAEYKARYERARARVEGTDESKVGGEDIPGSTGGEGKGKEPLRDI